MCLYNYNNKFETNIILNQQEHDLLSQIYKCIEANDNENAQKLTKQLIEIQSSKESIDALENAMNSLK